MLRRSFKQSTVGIQQCLILASASAESAAEPGIVGSTCSMRRSSCSAVPSAIAAGGLGASSAASCFWISAATADATASWCCAASGLYEQPGWSTSTAGRATPAGLDGRVRLAAAHSFVRQSQAFMRNLQCGHVSRTCCAVAMMSGAANEAPVLGCGGSAPHRSSDAASTIVFCGGGCCCCAAARLAERAAFGAFVC